MIESPNLDSQTCQLQTHEQNTENYPRNSCRVPQTTSIFPSSDEKYDNLVIPVLRKFVSKLKRKVLLRSFQSLTAWDFQMINDFAGVVQNMQEDKFLFPFREHWEKFLLFFPVISPFGINKILWDIIHLILILFLFFWIPLELSFFLDLPPDLYLAIIFFLLTDILLNFNTAYYQNGFLNFQRNRIKAHYYRSSFWPDLLTSSIFVLDFMFREEGRFNPITITKLVFYLRIVNLDKIYEKLIEIFKLRRTSLLDLFNLLSFSSFILHVFACLWFLLANQLSQTQSQTWLNKLPELIDDTNLVKYLYSLYWATVTIMTVGYGDFTATNKYEVVFSIFTIFIGCVVFGYIINTIGLIIGEINKEKSLFKQNIYIINKYMERKKINQHLQMKIRAYLKFLWQEEFTQNSSMEEEIISKLSGSLKEELLFEAHGAILNNFSMFYANFSENFLKQLLYKIKEVRLTPEDLIFEENSQTNGDIYFLLKGKVQIFLGNKESPKILRNIKEGECFGEIAFFSGLPRTASAQSKDFTTLFYIKQEDFMNLVLIFPEDYVNASDSLDNRGFNLKEKYCMIRDQILEKNYKSIGIGCFSCQEQDHLVSECCRIHFVSDKERLIKQIRSSFNPGARSPYISKTSRALRVKFNARKGQQILAKSREWFLQNAGILSLSSASSISDTPQNVGSSYIEEKAEEGEICSPGIDKNKRANPAAFAFAKNRKPSLKLPIKSPLNYHGTFLPIEETPLSFSHCLRFDPFSDKLSIEEQKAESMQDFKFPPMFISKALDSEKEMETSLNQSVRRAEHLILKPRRPNCLAKQNTDIWSLNRGGKMIRGSSRKLVVGSQKQIRNSSLMNQQRISKKNSLVRESEGKAPQKPDSSPQEKPLNQLNLESDPFEKMCIFKNYFPHGNLFAIVTAINTREKRRKREEFLKTHNHLAEYFKSAPMTKRGTRLGSNLARKRLVIAKNKVLAEDRRIPLSPNLGNFDTNENRGSRKRVSNIFRSSAYDGKSFFQKNRKLSFYDVVFQILTNKELRKDLQSMKKKNKKN